MSEQIVTDPFPTGAQFSYGMAEVDRVPKDDRRYDEIQTRSPVALIFEAPVADLAEAVKENRSGKRIARRRASKGPRVREWRQWDHQDPKDLQCKASRNAALVENSAPLPRELSVNLSRPDCATIFADRPYPIHP